MCVRFELPINSMGLWQMPRPWRSPGGGLVGVEASGSWWNLDTLTWSLPPSREHGIYLFLIFFYFYLFILFYFFFFFGKSVNLFCWITKDWCFLSYFLLAKLIHIYRIYTLLYPSLLWIPLYAIYLMWRNLETVQELSLFLYGCRVGCLL